MIEQQLPDSVERNQDKQFSKLPPQLKIYNRNFYLRNAREQALQQQITRQIQQLSEKPKLTPNSYMILVQKLEQKLEQIYHKHLQQKDHINFQHFQLIFNEMGRFEEITKQEDLMELELLITQLWLILVNYQLEKATIPKNILTSLMHILFCPYTLKQPQMVSLFEHAFPNLEEQRIRYIQKYPECKDQVINITQLVKLWLKMKRMFTTLANTVPKERKSFSQNYTPSFKPQINPKSREIADRSLQKYLSNNRLDNIKESKLNQLSGYISGGHELSYHEILYKRGLEKQQILKTNREQTPIIENQKTLTTEQTKKLVQNLYIIKEKREDIDYSKIKEQQQLKKCTFQPITIEYHKRNTTPTVKNYQKQIQRMQKGRKDKQKLKEAYENLGKVKPKSTGPPSFVQRQKPRLILQIKLGQQIVKLNLKGDEEAKIAAKKFVIKHGLNQSMQDVLQSIIEQQLQAL